MRVEKNLSDNGVKMKIGRIDCDCRSPTDIDVETMDHDEDHEIIAKVSCGDCGEESVVYYRGNPGWDLDPSELAVDGEIDVRGKSHYEHIDIDEWRQK